MSGSTRLLLSATRQTLAAASYSPYGSVSSYAGIVQPFGFAGQDTDGETGFPYLQARSYDPATSQFVSAHLLQSLTGQPYAYAGNDPLNRIDPSGLCTIKIDLGVASVTQETGIGPAGESCSL